jgi:quercetin dioxygenase-like cupin family protein
MSALRKIALVVMASLGIAATAAETKLVRVPFNDVVDGPAANFTGKVRVQSRFRNAPPSRVGGGLVSFAPGARTAWHTHPLGQTLIVVSGVGWVQIEGGSREEIRTGDIVVIPPNSRHWHGATSTSPMSHVAIAEALNDSAVTWFEHVRDSDYLQQPNAAAK